MNAQILILDSEPVVRSAVKTILESAGYGVRATAEPAEALEIIRASSPDLLITNVYLRGITGHDALSMFKKERPGLRVLMVSGLPDEEVIEHWTKKEGFKIFPKPFPARALIEKVGEILGKTSPRQLGGSAI